jgi:hypothetical protein
MQELISRLVEKTGMTEAQAQQTLEVIREFIFEKIPPMMQPMVDNFLGVNTEEGGGE